MTLKQAKAQLRSIGVSINKTVHGEYRVNFQGGTESTATYETDLESAVATGIAMVSGRSRRNPMYKKYSGREGSAEFRPMLLQEAFLLKYGDTVWALGRDGSAVRAKVNGKPKTWKRDPGKIEVPYKYGMYEYGTFQSRDFGPDGIVLVPL
jgi:hypothetical protein